MKTKIFIGRSMLLVIIVSCWIQYSKAHMINFPAAFHFDALSKNLSVLMGQRLFDMWRFVENACRFIVPSNIDSACCIVSEAVSEKVSDQRRLCTSFTEQSVQQLLKHEQTATTFSYTQHLEECTEMSTYYLNLNDKDDWEVIGEEDNIKIWRCNRPFCKFKGAEKWPCVKIRTIIDASPRSLMQLLMDSSRVTLFNKYSEGRTDVQSADDGKSKIVWNRSKHPLQVKPYDFCLFMHGSKMPRADAYFVVSKSVVHPDVPVHAKYTRSEMYVGLSILNPLASDRSKTELTTFNHVRYAGVHPYIASCNTFRGTVNYFRQLKKFAEGL